MELTRYIQNTQQELRQLIRDLCVIPAPSGDEEARAAFVKNWLTAQGAPSVTVDEAGNVLCSVGVTEDNPVTIVMAHLDTVFPWETPLILREEDGRFCCPGVSDDTAQLAVLLICARYFWQKTPRHGVIFAANVGEEGLGNLKGSRALVARYGSRMRELVTIDGFDLCTIVDRSVGSHRYRVTVRTKGGHSFMDFGAENAICHLSRLVARLYEIEVPKHGDSHTTYNVGTITGGTSVNTIAQQAQMLCEYRSDDVTCLQQMQQQFQQAFEAAKADGVEIDVEQIGDRPCADGVDFVRQAALVERAKAAVRTVLGKEPVTKSSSTDCNAAHGMGIPAVCLSGCRGSGMHTREEVLELDSLEPACRVVSEFLKDYFM